MHAQYSRSSQSRKMTSFSGTNAVGEGLTDDTYAMHERGPVAIGIEKELETLHIQIQPQEELISRDNALTVNPTQDESTEFMYITGAVIDQTMKTMKESPDSSALILAVVNSANVVDVDMVSRCHSRQRLGQKHREYTHKNFEHPNLLSQKSKSIRKQECFPTPTNSIFSSRYKNMGIRMKRSLTASITATFAPKEDFEDSEELCHVMRNPLQ